MSKDYDELPVPIEELLGYKENKFFNTIKKAVRAIGNFFSKGWSFIGSLFKSKKVEQEECRQEQLLIVTENNSEEKKEMLRPQVTLHINNENQTEKNKTQQTEKNQTEKNQQDKNRNTSFYNSKINLFYNPFDVAIYAQNQQDFDSQTEEERHQTISNGANSKN